MAEIKPLNKIASKWGERSAQASDEYKEGVTNPRRSWASAAIAADDARKEGLAAADARDAFVKGVQEAGDAKWKRKSQTLGPSRYRQGVKDAEPEFSKGFAKFHSVIAALTLPPRGPKGSPENIERVRVVADALHEAKVSW